MQEIRDALVAVNQSAGSNSHSTASKDITRPVSRTVVGGAPRTSFTYTSRALIRTEVHTNPLRTASSSSTSFVPAVAAVSKTTTEGSPSRGDPPAAAASTPAVNALPQQQQQPSSLLPATSLPSPSSLELSKMDESQIRAATYPINSPLLLQAGAGSGKTQTMASRVVFLLENGVPAWSILGICFTRQAAETLRERVRSTLPPTLARQAHLLKLKTFHAFGLECLRRFGDLPASVRVLDARQQYHLARAVVETYAEREKSSEAVANLVDYVNRVKTMKVPPIPQSDPGVQDAYLFPFYQRMLHEERKAVDFGDLQRMFYDLLRPVRAEQLQGGEDEAATRLGESSDGSSKQQQGQQLNQQGGRLVTSAVCAALREEYTHFVVDEFQDFNEIQVELLALLAGDACRVTCVGDPNQCIYTWRGALPNVFGVWQKRFPQTAQLSLALNYRSDGPIVEAANSVVRATQLAHYHREERAVTLVQCSTEDEELQAVPLVIEYVLRRRDPRLTYGDVAILCRTRRRMQLYCDILKSQRIPVQQLKAMAVDRLSTMRSLLAFLRLCLSPHSPEGDADVRLVLSTAPVHRLPAGSAKKFFLSLDSVCQARRAAETAQIRAWRHTVDDGALEDEDVQRARPLLPDPGRSNNQSCDSEASRQRPHDAFSPALGVHPETYSFFTILQELVYHNFSLESLSKVEMSIKSKKMIRHMVQLIVHAQEMLAQPSCDVEQVLRYVLREGGYESESSCDVATFTAVSSDKRPRCGDGADGADSHRSTYPKRVGALLMEQCTADHNEQLQQQHGHPSHDWRRRSNASTSSRRPGAAASSSTSAGNGSGGGCAFDDDILPPEEEAVMWQEQRMNLPELVLHTYRDVQEALQREVAQQTAVKLAAVESAGKSEDKTAVVGVDKTSSSSTLRAPSPSNGSSRFFSKGQRNSPSPLRRLHSGVDDSTSVFSNSSVAGTATLMQSLCPPAVVLRRVLDEFVALVSTDDYGPMRKSEENASHDDGSSTGNQENSKKTGAAPHWIGQVTVGTVHSAKGMEWPAVLLPGCWVGEYPVCQREEEKRVFYVGMSRAMKHLVCFTAAQKEGWSSTDVNTSKGGAAGKAGKGLLPAITGSQALEVTPYLNAVGDKLERVAFTNLKTAYLKERGYI